MIVRVICPNSACGAAGSIDEASLGQRGRCRQCGQTFDLAPPADQATLADPDLTTAEPAAAASLPRLPAGRDLGPPTLPEWFGRYQIVRPLGQGGMGAVYLAQDTLLGRAVALKVPFFPPAERGPAIQRFVREARAAATLDHPNLCPVFDVGEVDGVHYLTMPFIDGKPLAEALGRGRAVTEAQAAAVARKLALALQEAHDRGVVHRDLKPANIMVNRRRELVVMDFGLARLADGDEAPITRTGHVMGTALYMAPEQAAGSAAAGHPAVDIYSLGVILYELLTGVRPFEGPWSLVIGLKSVKDPAPPSTHRPDLDPTLDAICLKAIAQRPEDRHASMAEFARALGALLAVGSPQAPAPAGAPAPEQDPDRLAAQVFAGLNSREATSLRAVEPGDAPGLTFLGSGPPRRPRPAWVVGAAVVAVAGALLGVFLFRGTNQGPVPIATANSGPVDRVEPAPRLAQAAASADVPGETSPTPAPLAPTSPSAPGNVADSNPVAPPPPPGPTSTEIAPLPPALTDPATSAGSTAKEPAAPPVALAPRNRSQPKKKAARPVPYRTLFANGFLDGLVDHRTNPTRGIPHWSVENNLLVAQGPRGKMFLFREPFRNFDLRVEVLRVSEDSTGVFLFRAGEREDRMHGYAVGLGRPTDTGKPNHNANNDSCAESGSVSAWSFLPGHNVMLQKGASKAAPVNQWFPVEVRVRGNQFQVRINNGPLMDASDPADRYPTGQIGFSSMGGADGSILKIGRIEIRPAD